LTRNHLGKAVNLLIESGDPFFYSIPPQSVIKIGESKFRGEQRTETEMEFPLLVADMRDATNYFVIKERGGDMTKITQSPFGEGSFSALAKLLCMSGDDLVRSRDLMNLGIKEGNNLTCDLLVSDIYGESASAINLPGEIIASCFGKPDHSFSSREDKLKSLIILHSLDICNVASLLA
jgi:pantothenate kinase